MFPYNIGCCGCTGAGLPPNPVTTVAAGVPNPELLLTPVGAGALNAVGLLVAELNPPLFIPPEFTCAGG